MLNLGLTGGIGSGKSAASAVLEARGATIVDADKIAREVVGVGTGGLDAVTREFGDGVLAGDGSLNRPALATLVFGDQDALARLNAIVHPLVRARSQELIASAGADAVIVNDIPLLAEGSMAPSFQLVIVVVAPEEVRLERLTSARGMDRADAEARIRAQATDEQRFAIADVVLDNGGTFDELEAQIDRCWGERIAPYAAAMASQNPAIERIEPRPGARERDRARLDWLLRPLDLEARDEGEEFAVDAGAAEQAARAALHTAGWFGQERMKPADPGGTIELALR